MFRSDNQLENILNKIHGYQDKINLDRELQIWKNTACANLGDRAIGMMIGFVVYLVLHKLESIENRNLPANKQSSVSSFLVALFILNVFIYYFTNRYRKNHPVNIPGCC